MWSGLSLDRSGHLAKPWRNGRERAKPEWRYEL